ncbi:4336_t:CDS:2 [Dentiscutata heterogama]|uniref:4336_t:CDS:1 n=1 Tax=Dentiscutata heterogama TaxID=1316150 RepID=A0ACA9L4A6_9GLOM|nr:4336_t:CDS:2 [Dentiscutata heterogama]
MSSSEERLNELEVIKTKLDVSFDLVSSVVDSWVGGSGGVKYMSTSEKKLKRKLIQKNVYNDDNLNYYAKDNKSEDEDEDDSKTFATSKRSKLDSATNYHKTFTFTEPDNLELGRFSGIIQDPAISKKQVRFEIKDDRVYALALGANSMMRGPEKICKNNKIEIHDGETLTLMQASYFLKNLNKYPFKVSITKMNNLAPNLQSSLQSSFTYQNPSIGNVSFSPSLLHNDNDRENDEMETPSQLLREMISSQGDLDMIPDDDHDNTPYNDDRDSSDNGAEILDSEDSSKSNESDDKMISSESSYLGSSCESSESYISD